MKTYRKSRFSRLYLSAEPPERKLLAQLTEKAPNPPSFCRKKVPFFVLGRRWPPAPAGKFSPHAGAATHGNGISKLATHPPQHADAPSLQLAAVVLSPFPSHRRGHESAAAFSRSALWELPSNFDFGDPTTGRRPYLGQIAFTRVENGLSKF